VGVRLSFGCRGWESSRSLDPAQCTNVLCIVLRCVSGIHRCDSCRNTEMATLHGDGMRTGLEQFDRSVKTALNCIAAINKSNFLARHQELNSDRGVPGKALVASDPQQGLEAQIQPVGARSQTCTVKACQTANVCKGRSPNPGPCREAERKSPYRSLPRVSTASRLLGKPNQTALSLSRNDQPRNYWKMKENFEQCIAAPSCSFRS